MRKSEIELTPDEKRALEAIGEKLKMKREKLKIGQLELAAKVGISDTALRKIEYGEDPNPGMVTIWKIAEILNISPEELSLETSYAVNERKEEEEIHLLFLLKLLPLKKSRKLLRIFKKMISEELEELR